MASDSLNERSRSFNQLSPSSRSSAAAFHSSERIAKLELVASLLAKAEAMTSVALQGALDECTHYQRHHYLAALDEIIAAATEQVDELLTKVRPEKLEE